MTMLTKTRIECTWCYKMTPKRHGVISDDGFFCHECLEGPSDTEPTLEEERAFNKEHAKLVQRAKEAGEQHKLWEQRNKTLIEQRDAHNEVQRIKRQEYMYQNPEKRDEAWKLFPNWLPELK